jgi:hypothetical protein
MSPRTGFRVLIKHNFFKIRGTQHSDQKQREMNGRLKGNTVVYVSWDKRYGYDGSVHSAI